MEILNTDYSGIQFSTMELGNMTANHTVVVLESNNEQQHENIRWVEPVFTNEWVWSDGRSATITETPRIDEIYDDDGIKIGENIIEYSYDVPEEFYALSEFPTQQTILTLNNMNDDSVITAYRKYTPGHWEKKVGDEWVWDEDSGHWNDWISTFNGPILWGNVIGWDDATNDYIYGDEYYWMEGTSAIMDGDRKFTNKNVNLIYEKQGISNLIQIATRQWINDRSPSIINQISSKSFTNSLYPFFQHSDKSQSIVF